MASSPASTNAGPPPSGSRIGRPPQWTVSRSRKLARLYLYSTLPVEKILKVLEDDGFNPKKNSAQKTVHKMLDNDPRYLRPESRAEMSKRIMSLTMSPNRQRRKTWGRRIGLRGDALPTTELTSPFGQSAKAEDTPSFEFSASPDALGHSYFSIPFKGQEQEGTDATDPSIASLPRMIQDIKRRVSDCSTDYAFQLCTLIKEFTISISSDDGRSSSRRLSAAVSEASLPGDPPPDEAVPEVYESFPDPGFALPGDFLTAHTRSCADFPGQQHGKGNCWCSISKKTSAEEDSWVLPTGELSARARRVLAHPSPAHLGLRDSFGNTPLHLLAALEGYQEELLGMAVRCDRGSLRRVNTAGQTFLHVLNLEWFSDVPNSSTPLRRLLAYIGNTCPELVYETDVYGRTFFHRAHSLVRDPAALACLVSLFNPTLACRRDAFGFNPVSSGDPASPNPYIPPRRNGCISPQVEAFSRAGSSSRPQSSDEGSFLAYHARLVQVIQSSYTDPSIEDAEGRNGLHCLAEAILNQQTMDRHVQATGRPHLKRKLEGTKDSHYGTAASSPTTPTTTSSSSSTSPSSEAVLTTRLRHLQSLLDPSVGVSVMHYDRLGRTPLMAFIEHVPDDHDDKARTLQTILVTLVRADAGVLEARNRRGETPLLLAARLGRKVALATLLECGANVHARDADGRGVLELLDAEVGGVRASADS
ncbi:21a8c676-c933-4788-ac8c-b8b69e7ffa1a [Thermothielavioides terrestris]|uniref:21a8c676-c933-4788-ac8c-b8b69e7ffa1a n=1 Tax=Thermothielavioides terrestris TaxID=2587410 RepID=A0A446BXK9_9PEZI|nr:21a8c676-c933-4788-ac8c-b8b69e7ffa1a [Thermothielavioides terrestris]